MDKTTLAIDRKFIRKAMSILLLGGVLALILGIWINGIVTGEGWNSKSSYAYEVLTYLVIAALVFIIGLVITYAVGVKTNYMDCFRVRRSYAYEIRKQSVLKYSPIGAVIVCFVKSRTGYITLSERTPGKGTVLLFFIVAFVCYSLIIAVTVTFFLTLSKLGYIIAIAVQPWIFTVFASFHKIPVYLGIWNIHKAAILCIALFALWILSLKRLKRICYKSNMY